MEIEKILDLFMEKILKLFDELEKTKKDIANLAVKYEEFERGLIEEKKEKKKEPATLSDIREILDEKLSSLEGWCAQISDDLDVVNSQLADLSTNN